MVSDCPICGVPKQSCFLTTSDYTTGDRFGLRKCRRCAVVYIPAPGDLGHYYPPRISPVRAIGIPYPPRFL